MSNFFKRYSEPILLRKAFRKFVFEPTNFNISKAHLALSKFLEHYKSDVSTISSISYSGWLSGSLSCKLNKSDLEQLNPNFRVTIRRFVRKELLRSFRVHGLRAGYKVTFIPRRVLAAESQIPLLALKNVENVAILPTGSSRNTQFAIRNMQHQTEIGFPSPFTKANTFFYLDNVRVSRGNFSFEQNWLLAHLDQVVDLLRYLKDPECATRLIEYLPKTQLLARDVAKINFLINGTDSVNSEEFQILEIDRQLSILDQRIAQPFVKPQRHKNKVNFTNKEVDLAVPVTGFTELKSVIVFMGCQIMQDKKLILIENAADPIRDFVSGQWSYFFGGIAQKNAVLVDRESTDTVDVESGILLGGRNENNWYHWVIEYASRLSFDIEIPSATPILVSDAVPEAFLEVISSISKRTVLRLPKLSDWRVQKLYVAQPLAQILDSTVTSWEEGLFVNIEALEIYREKLLKAHKSSSTPQKIFLTRNSSHRGLTNQKELQKIAESYGYASIDPSSLSLGEQINLFRNAKTVIGASGAVMANYLFMSEGANIIALTNKKLWNFILPAVIAKISNVQLIYLLGKPKFGTKLRNSTELMHSDFEISEKAFRNLLLTISR